MGRTEIRLTIARPLAQVFAVYVHPDLWYWAKFRDARWISGQPWEIGSRMRIEPQHSFGAIVDQVVTQFEPNRRVDFICHFGGITMQSQVQFRALSESVTGIESQLEFVGTFSRVAGFAVASAIEQGGREFYEFLKRECESKTTADTDFPD